jgi:HK97 family phage portal protein
LKAKPLAAPGREQQFQESRVLGLEDLARAYGVPLSVVGLGKQSSYGSLNEEARSLVKYCIGPWSKLIEDEMRVALLTREERATLSLEHDLAALLRGDSEAEFKAMQAAVGGPFLSPNEARDWFGYNPREGGDEPLRPMNMAPAGADESVAGTP